MAADASAPSLATRLRRPSVVTTLGSLFVVMLFGWLAVNLQRTPADFFEVFLIGITTGCVYALVALGYTLVYGILELINFAHGDVFMLGGMFTITFATSLFGLHEGQGAVTIPIVFLTLVLVMATCGAINASIELIAYRPLRGKPRLAPLITAIGMSFVIQDIGLIWKGPNYVTAPDVFPRTKALLDRRGRLHLEQDDRRPRDDAGPAGAALPRAEDAAGEGDARDRPGHGRERDDGHQRQPDDLVHVRDRRLRSRARPGCSTRST